MQTDPHPFVHGPSNEEKEASLIFLEPGLYINHYQVIWSKSLVYLIACNRKYQGLFQM